MRSADPPKHVRAYVRFRPLSSNTQHATVAWDVQNDGTTVAAKGTLLGSTLEGTPTSSPSSSSPHTLFRYTKVFQSCENNASVFEHSVKPLLDQCLEGRNGSFLCYGQTESGKTHTIFGYDGEMGVVPLALEYLYNALSEMSLCHPTSSIASSSTSVTTRFRLAISFFEIHNETINDLLNPAGESSTQQNSPSLLVRESNGVVFVEGLSIRIADNISVAKKLLDYGNTNKTIGYSYLHAKSSRAHTVFSIQVAYEHKTRKKLSHTCARVFRVNFVDLAGSEQLAYQFGDAQQRETKSINLSLLSLRNTIFALANKEKFIPYRDSVLTRVLASSLCEESVAAVLCTCSLSPEHVTLTMGSLRFGDVAKMIEQKVLLNEFARRKDEGRAGLRLKQEVPEESFDIRGDKISSTVPQTAALVDRSTEGVVVEKIKLLTRQGPIAGVKCYNRSTSFSSSQKPQIALYLHAFGECSGSDWLHSVLRMLAEVYGMICYGIDFPGFGGTPGVRQSSRTEKLNDSGGPMEIVYDVLDYITQQDRKKKILILGWDWGGNMALVLGQSAFKTRVQALALYHPSYTSPLETLCSVSVPTLLIWSPRNQLHLISSGRKMARIIPQAKLVTLLEKPGSESESNFAKVEVALVELIHRWLKDMKFIPASISPLLSSRTGEITGSSKPKHSKEPPAKPQGREVELQEEDITSSSSSEDDVGDEVLPAGEQYSSSDDEDSLSTQSSFLACILSDPAAAATVMEKAIVEERARRTTKNRSNLRRPIASPILAFQQIKASNATHGKTEAQQAVSNLQAIITNKNSEQSLRSLQDALMRRGRQAHLFPTALSLLGHLPCIRPYECYKTFVDVGYFAPSPTASLCEELWSTCPRYPVGRELFARIPGISFDMRNSAHFGFRQPTTGGSCALHPYLRTYRARVSSGAAESRQHCALDVFNVTTQKNDTFSLRWTDVEEFNQPTKFADHGVSSTGESTCALRFEDNIVCRYHSIVTKVKIGEMALVIAPLVHRMPFAAALQEMQDRVWSPARVLHGAKDLGPINFELHNLQLEALSGIRRCINMIHHVQMGKDPDRLCVPDCGRLATFGQWHCHGMASVFAAYILPFSRVLGIEVRYRDGFYVSSAREGENSNDPIVPRAVADHTWLEVTLLPSMLSYVTDPSFHFDEPIVLPFDAAYSLRGHRYPIRNLEGGSYEPPPRRSI